MVNNRLACNTAITNVLSFKDITVTVRSIPAVDLDATAPILQGTDVHFYRADAFDLIRFQIRVMGAIDEIVAQRPSHVLVLR